MHPMLISLKQLDAGYTGNMVLKDVSLDVYPEDFIGIIGPNGGGKTTLLNIILGLLKPLSGSVTRKIEKSDIGYLPQVNQFDTKFPITVADVVLSGMTSGFNLKKRRTAITDKKVEDTLDSIGITTLKNRPIGELSGGELQRTMLARAIISSPKLLVLDEPNTYVDNKFEQELYRILHRLNERMAILLVSHDVGTISPYIKTIACVNGSLHYHPSNEISNEQLRVYNCPIEIVTHGTVPHRVIKEHKDH